jgi:hypothetical protein
VTTAVQALCDRQLASYRSRCRPALAVRCSATRAEAESANASTPRATTRTSLPMR